MNFHRNNPLTSPAESDAVPSPARRGFLTQAAALLATVSLSLLPRFSRAARPVEPPSVARPSQRTHHDQHRQPANRHRIQAPTTTNLNAAVQHHLRQWHQTGRLAVNERTAWLAYDFTSRRFLLSINASTPYQSASMIKPFIALAFFHKVQEGKLHYTPFQRQQMEAMIQYSDNQATNHFIELLNQTSRRSGPTEAERTLKQRHPDVFRQTRIVERIPGGGRSYRNKASALDYHRFLTALWYNQLPYAAELRRLMFLPNRDRIYTGATGVARQTQVLDKTGTTARLCGDMGILVAQGRDGRSYPYTFIGIIEKAQSAQNYLAWKEARGDIIRNVSSMTYSHLRQIHNLV